MTDDDPAAPAAKRPKYTAFSLAEKVWLLDHSRKNPKVNSEGCGKALAAEVNAGKPEHEKRAAPNKNTVNGWKKNDAKLREQFQKESAQGTTGKLRSKEAKHAQMEEALYVWFRQRQGRDMALTEEIVREKAKQLGGQLNVPDNFGYSAGWLHNFKKRYGIKSYVLHGEAGSANQEGIDLARSNLRELLVEGGYEADDVYNQDESGAFWRQMPTRTLATGKRAGGKKEKERATFSLCTNASGSHKMELFVIGKAARPRSFPKNFQPKRDLDVRYAHNKTAWMTGAEFSRWTKEVNTEMKRCGTLTLCMQTLHATLHANAACKRNCTACNPSDSIDCLVRQLNSFATAQA